VDCAKDRISEFGELPSILKSSICKHFKRRSRCKICDGREVCVHDKMKKNCRQCRLLIKPRECDIGVSTQISSTLEEIFQMTPLSGHITASAHQVGDKSDLENREHDQTHARFSWLQALCPVFVKAHAAKSSPISSDMAKASHMQSKYQSICKTKSNTKASKNVRVLTIEKMSKKGTLQLKKSRQQSRFGCDGLQIQQADASIKADEMLVGRSFVLPQAAGWAPVYQKCSETIKNQPKAKDSVKKAVVKKKSQKIPAIHIPATLPPPKAQSDSMSTFAHAMNEGSESLGNEHFSHSKQIGNWSCQASFNFKLCDVEAPIESGTLTMGQHDYFDFSMHESLDLHFIDHWQEWMCNSERNKILENRQDDIFEMIPT
jgi:hypothetical protein